MKLVIDIQDDYKRVIDNLVADGKGYLLPYDVENGLAKAVKCGTPLPKGHGDLKDELDLDLFAPSLGTDEYLNDLMAKHNIDYVNGDDEDKVRAFASDLIHSCMNVIKTAPTIIEADKQTSGCSSCPHSGSIIDGVHDCPDAYTEQSQYCGLNNKGVEE